MPAEPCEYGMSGTCESGVRHPWYPLSVGPCLVRAPFTGALKGGGRSDCARVVECQRTDLPSQSILSPT